MAVFHGMADSMVGFMKSKAYKTRFVLLLEALMLQTIVQV